MLAGVWSHCKSEKQYESISYRWSIFLAADDKSHAITLTQL
jgi:hypothetical protein